MTEVPFWVANGEICVWHQPRNGFAVAKQPTHVDHTGEKSQTTGNTVMPICLSLVYGSFHTATAERVVTERMAHKAEKIYPLAFHKQSLPIPEDNVSLKMIVYPFCFSYKQSLSWIFLSMFITVQNVVMHIPLFYLRFLSHVFLAFFLFYFILV